MKSLNLILTSLLFIPLLSCGPSDAQVEVIKAKFNYELELKRIEKGYDLQESDLNGDGINEKYYIIGDKIAIVEGNGKSALDLLKSNNQPSENFK